MPTYRGRFRYASNNGSAHEQSGACQIHFDGQTFTLTPDTGAPLVFDLGDLDAVAPAGHEIQLPLYTSKTLTLHQFGKSYEDLSRELLEQYRARTLECLLLADMQPLDCFTGEFALERDGAPAVSGPAEVRLFKSNLAVLPNGAQAFQWRLADIDAHRFDAERYDIVLEAGGSVLRLGRLGKRTALFETRLRDAIHALKAESGEALHAILPFLNGDELHAAAGILREGRSASMSTLRAVHPRIPDVLAANAVDETLKPYYDDLLGRTAKGMLFAGFKMIRPEDRDLLGAVAEDAGSGETAASAGDRQSEVVPDADAAGPAALYWFFFPMAAAPGSAEPGHVVAWEASSRAGRATYFFRLADPAEATSLHDPAQASVLVERGVQHITRVLGLLNFRRRPLYLSSDELTSQAAFRRYAIAERRMPELRHVRAAFLGRAIHNSLENWQGQVKAILEKGGRKSAT